MAGVPTQELRVDAWHKSYTRREQNIDPALSFESDSPILDETIAIVKEKVWSLRAALRAAAEALVGYGLNPSVVGYSSVPLGEDNQLAEKNDGEAALQKVIDDEILSRPMHSGRLDNNLHQRQGGESSSLLHHEEYEDESGHAFVEAGRKEKDERKSLTGSWQEDDVDEDESGHLKDK